MQFSSNSQSIVILDYLVSTYHKNLTSLSLNIWKSDHLKQDNPVHIPFYRLIFIHLPLIKDEKSRETSSCVCIKKQTLQVYWWIVCLSDYMINLQQQGLIFGARHPYKQIQILLVDHRIYRAGWCGSLLPLACVTSSTECTGVAFSTCPSWVRKHSSSRTKALR